MKRKDDGIDVEGRAPGFFLYPSDLERELRPLPVGAKACWTMMLLRMHFSKRRGYLEHETGKPFSADDIARLVGMSVSQVNRHLYEMEHTYGTFSRDEDGVIFNRRMVKDTAISQARKTAGKAGGNPVLLKQSKDLNKQNENLLKQESNQNEVWGSTRARSSSSSSFSPEGNTPPAPSTGNGNGKPHGPLTLPAVAGEIHSRHPAIRRDCSAATVEKKLAAILKHKHIPVAGADEYLAQINQNHEGACRSPDWRKEDGQFAKSLENWLAPTKERYDVKTESKSSRPPEHAIL